MRQFSLHCNSDPASHMPAAGQSHKPLTSVANASPQTHEVDSAPTSVVKEQEPWRAGRSGPGV